MSDQPTVEIEQEDNPEGTFLVPMSFRKNEVSLTYWNSKDERNESIAWRAQGRLAAFNLSQKLLKVSFEMMKCAGILSGVEHKTAPVSYQSIEGELKPVEKDFETSSGLKGVMFPKAGQVVRPRLIQVNPRQWVNVDYVCQAIIWDGCLVITLTPHDTNVQEIVVGEDYAPAAARALGIVIPEEGQ